MRPRKRFAQHWLRSDRALNEIVAAADIQTSDRVLEIGPGRGALTRRLLAAGAAVTAVEIDRDLCRYLCRTFGDADTLLLLEGDVLRLDLATLLTGRDRFAAPNKVVANIPYNITGPILETLLGTIAAPTDAYERIVLLVQKEIGDRLCARPGSKTYGALSVRVQYLADCEIVAPVPARAFSPPPKVDSAIVRLMPRPFAIAAVNPKQLATLVALGFASRRKMLRNNLKACIGSDRLMQLLKELAIHPQARAEAVSVRQWVELSNALDREQELHRASAGTSSLDRRP
ncbi:dimethyladenosine transferase [Rubidibacter lacunae KORDI 51-2]|uniref:Ribosomal RNA small subunit methyltransferase A n=1 Tax=Rubidibacter lacunae KORDI 51-2 TaxID=582515 RepID=U5D6D3_9CHRO|nr:16S rRNA (adenine(1518)-N(6)/adenine(1519)-N(6))-dimethyltransferase RsmA [Rubidibacter lacunae]ERN40203.1 dimethyladenosine transferase [Rubidibacter lacunae KORDI 51-2]